jgi:hypothetical protein
VIKVAAMLYKLSKLSEAIFAVAVSRGEVLPVLKRIRKSAKSTQCPRSCRLKTFACSKKEFHNSWAYDYPLIGQLN